jgi:hypothetical protein
MKNDKTKTLESFAKAIVSPKMNDIKWSIKIWCGNCGLPTAHHWERHQLSPGGYGYNCNICNQYNIDKEE